MKSIDFLAANTAIAKDQPQYNTLFAHINYDDPNRGTMVCMELTDEDIEEIKKERKLWVNQLTFGRPYTPMSILTKSPYLHDQSGSPLDENRLPSKEWDLKHFAGLDGEALSPLSVCGNCGRIWDVHYFSTRQCEL